MGGTWRNESGVMKLFDSRVRNEWMGESVSRGFLVVHARPRTRKSIVHVRDDATYHCTRKHPQFPFGDILRLPFPRRDSCRENYIEDRKCALHDNQWLHVAKMRLFWSLPWRFVNAFRPAIESVCRIAEQCKSPDVSLRMRVSTVAFEEFTCFLDICEVTFCF